MTARQVRTGAGKGVAKSATGAFCLALLIEWGLIPADLGPNTLILLTWAAGQFAYSAMSPSQWRSLLGGKE